MDYRSTRKLLKSGRVNCKTDGHTLNTKSFELLSGVYVPNVFMNIFCHLDTKCLMEARMVCKSWKYMIDCDVWYERAKRYKKGSYSYMTDFEFEEFDVSYIVGFIADKYDPFNKNLLRNVYGEDEFEHWDVLPPYLNLIRIEDSPVDMEASPDDPDFGRNGSCFSVLRQECELEQVVDLSEYGIGALIMDYHFPLITASDWYTGKPDVGCSYKMIVTLLNESYGAIDSQTFTRVLTPEEGNKWHKATIHFKYYPPGVRHVRFLHGSKETEHLPDMHDVKMAGSSLKLTCPPSFSKKVCELEREYYEDIPIFGSLLKW